MCTPPPPPALRSSSSFFADAQEPSDCCSKRKKEKRGFAFKEMKCASCPTRRLLLWCHAGYQFGFWSRLTAEWMKSDALLVLLPLHFFFSESSTVRVSVRCWCLNSPFSGSRYNISDKDLRGAVVQIKSGFHFFFFKCIDLLDLLR